jgi:DUF4097 and DUF4098 domain-containing protein YvlB
MFRFSYRGAAALLLFCLVTPSRVRGQDDCEHRADRAANTQLTGIERVRIISHAGSLEVAGRAGVSGLSARGRACASSAGDLDELQLEVRRDGSTLVVEATQPDRDVWYNNHYAYQDVVVELPQGTAVSLEDGSGELTVTGTGATRITDGSGEIEASQIRGAIVIDDGSGNIDIRTVAGSVEIEDGSGEVYVDDVTGAVEVEDGSGDVRISRVRGSVLLSDGSGELRVANVTDNVTVDDDGSGSIRVEGVGGNFTVDDDGSGDVSYSEVTGRVSVPDE